LDDRCRLAVFLARRERLFLLSPIDFRQHCLGYRQRRCS
jgi:hypothetical protein